LGLGQDVRLLQEMGEGLAPLREGEGKGLGAGNENEVPGGVDVGED